MVRISMSKIAALIDREGKGKAERMLQVIKRHGKIAEALSSEVGAAILEDAINKLGILLGKIADDMATDKDKLEYNVLRDIVDKWATRITRYQKTLNDIESGGK